MAKYWIEEYYGNFSHGNSWFVFTTVCVTEGNDRGNIIISIPYHAYATAYSNDDDCDDFNDHPEAWDEWLSYTLNQRREYVREFRRNNSLEPNRELAEYVYA